MAGPDKSFEKALLAWVVEQGTNATGDAASDYSKVCTTLRRMP